VPLSETLQQLCSHSDEHLKRFDATYVITAKEMQMLAPDQIYNNTTYYLMNHDDSRPTTTTTTATSQTALRPPKNLGR